MVQLSGWQCVVFQQCVGSANHRSCNRDRDLVSDDRDTGNAIAWLTSEDPTNISHV